MGSSSPGNSPWAPAVPEAPGDFTWDDLLCVGITTNSAKAMAKMNCIRMFSMAKKGSLETFPERFNNSDGQAKKQKGALNIPSNKFHWRLSMSGPVTAKAKAKRRTVLSISSLRKFHCRCRRNAERCFEYTAQESPIAKFPWAIQEHRWWRRNAERCFQYPAQESPTCRFSPRRSATDLAKRSAELLAAALLFARSVTDHSPCTIYKRLNESDNEDEMHKMFSRKPHPRASAK